MTQRQRARHQGWNHEYCVQRAVSSDSPDHPQEVLLSQFNLYVNKSEQKFHWCIISCIRSYIEKAKHEV